MAEQVMLWSLFALHFILKLMLWFIEVSTQGLKDEFQNFKVLQPNLILVLQIKQKSLSNNFNKVS